MSLSVHLRKGIAGSHGYGGGKRPGTGPSCFDGTLSPYNAPLGNMFIDGGGGGFGIRPGTGKSPSGSLIGGIRFSF